MHLTSLPPPRISLSPSLSLYSFVSPLLLLRCSAGCYDKKLDGDGIADCVVQCQTKSQVCQRVVSQELNEFQQRLQRAMVTCQDKVREEITPLATRKDADQNKLQEEATRKFEKCANGVVNDSIALLKNLEARIKSQI